MYHQFEETVKAILQALVTQGKNVVMYSASPGGGVLQDVQIVQVDEAHFYLTEEGYLIM